MTDSDETKIPERLNCSVLLALLHIHMDVKLVRSERRFNPSQSVTMMRMIIIIITPDLESALFNTVLRSN